MQTVLISLLVACGADAPESAAAQPAPAAKEAPAKKAPAKSGLALVDGGEVTFTPCDGGPLLVAEDSSPVYESDASADGLIVYERLGKAKTHTLKKYKVGMEGDGCKVSIDKGFQEIGGPAIKATFELLEDVLVVGSNQGLELFGLDGKPLTVCEDLKNVSRVERKPGVKNTVIGKHKNAAKEFTVSTSGCTAKELYQPQEYGSAGYYYGVMGDGTWVGNFTNKGVKSQIMSVAADGSQNWAYKAGDLGRVVSDVEVVGDHTILVDTGSKRELVVLDGKGAEVAKWSWKADAEALQKYGKPTGLHHIQDGTFLMLVRGQMEDKKTVVHAVRVDL